MRILHTSDWHLGDRLLEKSRHDEFRAFLTWLIGQMKELAVDALLVSGDIFDTRDPGAPALEMLNEFLSLADSTGCRHIILTAGNHDGVPILDAAKPLLERYHVNLINHLNAETAETCLVPLCGKTGKEEALVCAVPFLRPSEVSRALSDANLQDGENAYSLGVHDVLTGVAKHAERWQKAHPTCPVFCMAHLTVSGTTKSGSELDIVVGGIESINAETFADVFNYVALGHIHKGYSPDNNRIHYSGSPLPMSIDEAAYEHRILLIDTFGLDVKVRSISVPRFICYTKEICQTYTELTELPNRLQELSQQHGGVPVHLELHYHGSGVNNLNVWVAENLSPELVPHYRVSMWREGSQTLEHLEYADHSLPTPNELFERKLTLYNNAGQELSENEKQMLRSLFASVYNQAQNDENREAEI